MFLMAVFASRAQDTLSAPAMETATFTGDSTIVEDSYTKVEFDADFKERYRSADFIYVVQPPEITWWDRFLMWLSSLIGKSIKISNPEVSLGFVKIALKVIAVIITILIVYFIVRALLKSEGKWIFGRNLSKKIIHHDSVEKNLQATDFQKLIQETESAGDLRLAIRYYYLWLLKRMSERELIKWDPDKTNSDYLYELKNEKHKDDFSYLSYLYNYIWYGEFTIDNNTFEKVRTAFRQSINSL